MHSRLTRSFARGKTSGSFEVFFFTVLLFDTRYSLHQVFDTISSHFYIVSFIDERFSSKDTTNEYQKAPRTTNYNICVKRNAPLPRLRNARVCTWCLCRPINRFWWSFPFHFSFIFTALLSKKSKNNIYSYLHSPHFSSFPYTSALYTCSSHFTRSTAVSLYSWLWVLSSLEILRSVDPSPFLI